MRGPIDYLVVGFEGNKFNGEILRELDKATQDGTIRVLALGLVVKDESGVVTTLDVTEDMVEITATAPRDDSLITSDDIEEVGDLLQPNTAAGLLVVEHLWAVGLKQAIVNAGGFLIADGRIHPDAAAELSEKEDK